MILAAWILGASLAWSHAAIEKRLQDLNRRIAGEPARGDLVLERAELHRLHRDWPAALADYGLANALDPTLREVAFCRGRMLLESGRAEEALTALDGFLSQVPEHLEGHLIRGRTLMRLGRPRKALGDYDWVVAHARRLTPELVLEQVSAAERATGPEEAIRLLDQGMGRIGSVITLERRAVEILRRAGQFGEAIGRVRRILARLGRKERWLELMGNILTEAGLPEDAKTAYRRALREMGKLPPRLRKAEAMAALEKRLNERLKR